jgi:ABC-2 type transport system ATP-binding protein
MIRVSNLTKYYGTRRAINDISFTVDEGEIVGFLGPNAAGKSTTMRIITGYLMPTRGEAWVGQCNMITHSLEGRRHIGYMPEVVPLYVDMTTRGYLEYVGRLRGLSRQQARTGMERVVEICALEEYVDVHLGKLSKGFRQRVGLAQAIIHEPEVLILDEPTIGIDPLQMVQTRKLIKELGSRCTILLSTHLLSEVSAICDRIIVIDHGTIVAKDRIENLSALLKSTHRLRLRVQGPAADVAARFRSIEDIENVSWEEPYHVVEYPADREPHARLMEAIVQEGWTLLAMEAVEMSLEDIFLQLTARKDGGG